MILRAWPRSQAWPFFTAVLVASGRRCRNTNGMMISKNSMRTNRMTPTTWFAVEAAYRAGQHGQPEPGLGQQACPAVFLPLAWLVRLAAPDRDRVGRDGRFGRGYCLAPRVQAAGGH